MMLDTAKCVANFCLKYFFKFQIIQVFLQFLGSANEKTDSSFLEWGLLGWGVSLYAVLHWFSDWFHTQWSPPGIPQTLAAQTKHALPLQFQFCYYTKCWLCDDDLPKQGFKTSNLLFYSHECVVNIEKELFSSTPFLLLHVRCLSNVIVKEAEVFLQMIQSLLSLATDT